MTEREIFIATLHQSGTADRAAFLDRACGGETSLRERVAALIDEHERLGDFLETADPVVAQARERNCEEPGTVIGPYKLVEQIGEGGMGLVFMAEQSHPVRRRVALKVLKPGLDTRHVLARFEAERQALAMMDHPHIAKVFDAGTTPAGRPYFVMELVRGVPITEFCDQRRFDPRRRLELFVEVCRAVQHAHQKGVIHRDLKPSNVLVTLHDTVAVPKVIDFGIAKATGERLTERTLVTHFAQMVGTPLYMSPEQAEMNGLDVDTRSDVYALGVLLYELLTGATPFGRERLKSAGCDEVRRILREEEPPRPSRQVATLGAAAVATVAEQRGVDARQFGHLLRGDLDWVVMKALEKDRNRRYESASAFAQDVERYLAGEAVQARPPSVAYRLRKFAGRNRTVVLAASVVVVSLVAATAVSVWQAVRATEAQREAETAGRRAATEAAIAQAVNDFLQRDLLGQVDSVPMLKDEILGNADLTMKQALDQAAIGISERFQGQPLVEAAVQHAVGRAYARLGIRQGAVSHLERAVALRRTHLGPDHPDTLVSMANLAEMYSWVSRHSEAIALQQQVLDFRKAQLGPDHPDTLASALDLGEAHWMADRLTTSIPLLEQVLEKLLIVCGPTHVTTLETTHTLAMNYTAADRLAESMALHETLLAARKSAIGPDNDQTPWLRSFAQACQRAGKLDRADQLLREALEHLQKQNDSLSRRNGEANTLGWLAKNLLLQHKYAEAEPLARAAVQMNQPEMPRHYDWVGLLGDVLVAQQRYAEAEPLLLQAYQGMKKREAFLTPNERLRLDQAGQRVDRFYQVTNQPDKAGAWRAKLLADQTAAQGP